jgi:hypothetical protein
VTTRPNARPPAGIFVWAVSNESGRALAAGRWRCHVRGKYVKSQEITRRYAIFLLFFCTAAA